jgi:hypothetical protein
VLSLGDDLSRQPLGLRIADALKAPLDLAPRTRSSHTRAQSPNANFGFKRGARTIELLVSL